MSVLIGKHIVSALKGYSDLNTAVGSRIFPVVYPTNSSVIYPYITYASNGFTEDGTKDGIDGSDVNVTIEVCSKSYPEMENIAALVVLAMREAEGAEYTEFSADEHTLTVGKEDYDIQEDCFFVPLNYSIVTSENE